MTIAELLLPEFDEEMAKTRKLLERVPEGHSDYKPHPKSMPLASLASHVARMPDWAKHTFAMDVFDVTGQTSPPKLETTKDLLETFDKGVAETRPLLAATPDADFQKTWTMIFNGKPFIEATRYKVYREVVMNHLVHHRAQLGVYIRMNESAIPGMYGPSADEMEAWKQANP